MIQLFFQSIVLFLIYLSVHWVLLRTTGPKFFMAKSLVLLLVLSVVLFFRYSSHSVTSIICIQIFFIGITNAYLIFLINLQNSISFRILRELSKTTEGFVKHSKLQELYSTDQIISDRLKEMEENGFIVRHGEVIKTTNKGKWFGYGIFVFQKVFGINLFG
ncbi:hypothetical protein JWG41_01210 [Leptospira sp. 201903075]|uniref:hypothetical protein n=1 Tax=Leptospira chreensis TaxID=2810035 RepID=UPI0019638151|nr:hypothetical protein [Leptospira chreensis]MBM9589047.1 hypothetical protein [Leptospira chreensis]